jgi:hypothetical protein
MVVTEMRVSFDYVLYEMDWFVFLEAYNWLLMYKHGHTRSWVKPGEKEGGMKYRTVYDEANGNWIDYMESESKRYTWMERQNCFWLKAGD